MPVTAFKRCLKIILSNKGGTAIYSSLLYSKDFFYLTTNLKKGDFYYGTRKKCKLQRLHSEKYLDTLKEIITLSKILQKIRKQKKMKLYIDLYIKEKIRCFG